MFLHKVPCDMDCQTIAKNFDVFEEDMSRKNINEIVNFIITSLEDILKLETFTYDEIIDLLDKQVNFLEYIQENCAEECLNFNKVKQNYLNFTNVAKLHSEVTNKILNYYRYETIIRKRDYFGVIFCIIYSRFDSMHVSTLTDSVEICKCSITHFPCIRMSHFETFSPKSLAHEKRFNQLKNMVDD